MSHVQTHTHGLQQKSMCYLTDSQKHDSTFKNSTLDKRIFIAKICIHVITAWFSHTLPLFLTHGTYQTSNKLNSCNMYFCLKLCFFFRTVWSVTHLHSFLLMFICFGDRERQSVSGEGQRERETQNPKQAPGSELSAQSLTRGSNSRAVRSWPEPESDAQPTEPPRRHNPQF